MAVLWGGLLHSSLTAIPPFYLQMGWEPIAVLWGGLLHSILTPTPLIHLQQGVGTRNSAMERFAR